MARTAGHGPWTERAHATSSFAAARAYHPSDALAGVALGTAMGQLGR